MRVQVDVQKRRFRAPVIRGFLSLLLLLVVSPLIASVCAQDTPVPPELQAAIFQKVFSYDRTLPAGATPNLVIAFSGDSTQLKDRLVKAFEEVGIKASALLDIEIKGISGINVLYVATEGRSFKDLCQRHSVLSITGFPSLVEKGEVAVGLAVNDAKPKIVVHRQQLKAEGHELAANLLRLAKVID